MALSSLVDSLRFRCVDLESNQVFPPFMINDKKFLDELGNFSCEKSRVTYLSNCTRFGVPVDNLNSKFGTESVPFGGKQSLVLLTTLERAVLHKDDRSSVEVTGFATAAAADQKQRN